MIGVAGIQSLVGSRLVAKLPSLESKENKSQVVSGWPNQKFMLHPDVDMCKFLFPSGLPAPF